MSVHHSQAARVSILDEPVSGVEKAEYVRGMFDDIAARYDLLNTVLSAGVHRYWRRFATRCACLEPGNHVLDVCTGTGDWTVDLRKAVGRDGIVAGIDFSWQMLRHGDIKSSSLATERVHGDAVRLPFRTDMFHAATVGFGIRNIPRIREAFSEMRRVIQPGGRVVCLEFAEPHPGPFATMYNLYSRSVLPAVGGAISGRRDAYAYLPESVRRFKSRTELSELMEMSGLISIRTIDLTGGLVCVHVGTKPDRSHHQRKSKLEP